MKNSNSLGQPPFHTFLCGPSKKHFFFKFTFSLYFECKINSELSLFSPEGIIYIAKKKKKKNAATKEDPCRVISLQRSQPPDATTSFFHDLCGTTPLLFCSLPRRPNPSFVVFRVTMWLLLLLLTWYFRQHRLHLVHKRQR